MSTPWTNSQKIFFRCLASYAMWYIFFPMTIELPPIWSSLGPWIGENIFGFLGPIDTSGNGSGDRTINYVAQWSILTLSVFTALIWSVVDRNRPSYNDALYWVTVVVRYYLAMTLMNYGFAKIFKTQFPFPSLSRLQQPFGDASPMGLAWTYMGYSTSFNYFTGFGEALAGFLLFFRSTTLVGTFVGIPVMATIVAMNFSYDIPVKLYSTNLLLLLVFLLLPHYRRLLNFFLLNQTAKPHHWYAPDKDKLAWRWRLVLKYGFVGLLLYNNISGGQERVKKYGDQRAKPPLYGLYIADEVLINGDTIPPLITDDNRWHTMAIDRPDNAIFRTMTGEQLYAKFKPDTTKEQVEFLLHHSMEKTANLDYEVVKKGLIMKGILVSGGGNQSDTIKVTFRKKDLNDYELIRRGFHWINEYPYNR
ncbi:MAG: hypothetical protein AAGJ18_22935 [Bacteroidota bacterium]